MSDEIEILSISKVLDATLISLKLREFSGDFTFSSV